MIIPTNCPVWKFLPCCVQNCMIYMTVKCHLWQSVIIDCVPDLPRPWDHYKFSNKIHTTLKEVLACHLFSPSIFPKISVSWDSLPPVGLPVVVCSPLSSWSCAAAQDNGMTQGGLLDQALGPMPWVTTACRLPTADLGPDSIGHLTRIGNPIVEIRRL